MPHAPVETTSTGRSTCSKVTGLQVARARATASGRTASPEGSHQVPLKICRCICLLLVTTLHNTPNCTTAPEDSDSTLSDSRMAALQGEFSSTWSRWPIARRRGTWA